VRERFKFEQEAAIEFLSQTIRPKYDPSFVMGFNLKPEVTQDFTADRDKLFAGIHMLRPGNLMRYGRLDNQTMNSSPGIELRI
jgi:Ca-activated chloride channel family protein